MPSSSVDADAAHALLERHGIEAVDEHQTGNHAVVGEPPCRVLVERGEDPLEALAVELHQRPGELLGERVALDLRRQLLDARDEALRVHQHSPVGVCITFLTLPLPVYMCTPHGRHGSNEWTARMMSTPLKSSGPFSSKIGVFCTASSYGPGVP
jgi:hypothetical protein